MNQRLFSAVAPSGIIHLGNYLGAIKQWLIHYNEKRRHGGYGMNRLMPVQKITASLFNSLNIIPLEKVTLAMQSYKN